MIPANHRRMGHPSSHADICTAALWSCCRCPKCNPDPASPSRTQAAAVRVIAPPAADGGTPTTPGDAGATPPDPAADRTFPLSGNPIGGLSDQISAVPYPAPKHLAAVPLSNRECSRDGGPFKRTC